MPGGVNPRDNPRDRTRISPGYSRHRLRRFVTDAVIAAPHRAAKPLESRLAIKLGTLARVLLVPRCLKPRRSCSATTARSIGGERFADRQGTLIERLGLGIAALFLVKDREIGEDCCYVEMIGAASPFFDCQGTLIKRLGLGIAALSFIKVGEIAEGRSDIGIVTTLSPFYDHCSALEKRLGFGVAA